MSKKHVLTPRKSPRLVEATSTDEVHAPTFNILTQTPPPKNNEISAKGGSSQSKNQITQKEKISQAKKKDDAHQHVEQTEKPRMDQPSVSMREYVDNSNTDVIGVFNADIPGSSTSKPPTLDDYPDLTMTKIVELDPILNVTTTLDLQPRNRNPDKYDTSLYIRLSEGEISVRRGPILSRIKHLFESHNGFEVAAELINEFSK
uniref:Ulp1 protease family, C-terminal catalytic domain containing protein n=1 Tax=Solanum tuberosum TaxID=4113 RepID=M1DWM1_SOLTU